jgi:PiT family inorganic phosphate transporter
VSTGLLLVVLVVITALIFDFTNGFHDSANAMATSIATGALRPRVAVGLGAVLNVAGAFLSTAVAKTISGGIVDDALVTPQMVFAGLAGAILWNLTTWLFGLPSSSSHALFGGLIGAVLVGAGVSGVNPSVIVSKILLPAVIAPVVAGLAAALAVWCADRITRRLSRERAEAGFRRAQPFTGGMVALAHGTSDGQKTMGVITLVLITSGYQESGTGPQSWVVLAAGLAIGLGTFSGGWRIMRTMGHGLVAVDSRQGFAAEASSTASILASSHLGIGLSTTQVVSGAIVGVGLGRKDAQVHWRVAGRMGIAWLLTLPAAGVVGGLATLLTEQGPLGVAIVFLLLAAGSLGIWLISRRNRVTHANVGDSDEVLVLAEPQTGAKESVSAG